MKKNLNISLTRYASAVLHIGFIIVIAELCVMTLCLVYAPHTNQLYALRLYREMLEYILLDVVLLAGGMTLFEVARLDSTEARDH